MEDVITNTTNFTPSDVTYRSVLSTPISSSTMPSASMPSTSGETVSGTGFFSGKMLRYALIILILAFLGFNIFSYLGNVTQLFANIFGPIFLTITKFLGIAAGETAKTVTGVAATGIKGGVDVAAGTILTSANVLEKTLTGGYSKNNIDNSLDKALLSEKTKPKLEPTPDETGSGIQSSKTSRKSGFCYIGEDRGFRSCVKVNEDDECLSGDIFPTREICINPNLRE